ncbi:MAG: 4-amino-4-deoxy-L-arabinose transferase [Steroidobacteraceae bacterium]
MTAVAFALILTGVLLNACAQLLLKAGTNAIGHIEFSGNGLWTVTPKLIFEPHILAGLACYAISVVVWIGALSRTPVSIAYPMLSIGYIVNAVAAWYLFAEALTPTRIAGIAVIIVGVVLITRT